MDAPRDEPTATPTTLQEKQDERVEYQQTMETPGPPTSLRIGSVAQSDAPSNASSSSQPPQNVTNPEPFSAWSASSERQLGHHAGASDTSDRVFPIRSVVSVDPAGKLEDYFPPLSDSEGRSIPVNRPAPARGETSADLKRSDTVPISPKSTAHGEQAQRRRRKSTLGGPMSSIQADAVRHGSQPLELNIADSDKDTEEERQHQEEVLPVAAAVECESLGGQSQTSLETTHVTTRFTHAMTDDGHAIITGRDGVLQRCEDEPIHTPGAVQGFGVLVALQEENDGRFVARYISENVEKMLGYTPHHLFKLHNFLDILTEEQQDNLLDHIDFIRDEDADPAVNGPEVFSISIRPPKRKSTKLWCAIHINPAHPDLVICEFEQDDDQNYPLRPADENTPDSPADTLQANPTFEEIETSTEVLSKPLRILRSARKRRGEQGAMQVFDIMSQVQEQLATAPNLESFLKILVGIVKELTGFHRVMIYQFDSSFNGKVVTELVDPAKTRDLYHGLNFPASDIPRQARDLYKLNKVRLLYDRDLETSRIVCRTKEDLDTPLDLSHSYLRAMSPIHLKYLANMAVRSSMSISLNAFNELWGLIACHSYGDQGMRVSFPIRKMCRLVGDTASRNIERLSYASRLQARKLINTAPSDKNPTGYIIASSDDLLKLFDADFGLLSIKGETKILGIIEHSQEALAMLEYLRMRKFTAVVASQDVREDFPDLRYPPGFLVLAGLLYVPLSVGGSDFIVFFRKGQVKEVRWAGNPYEKIIRDGTAGYLEPRTSFKTWHETVLGKCREWNEEQVETAAVLCLVYGKFIEVWRQKEAALQNSKLTRLLLANSAHEVRTPLNAIINYLEIALEGSLDQETRENLAKSHSASKSLIYVINDLLDLTKTEEGQNLIKDEVFDLPNCIQEATEPFEVDARRKGIEYKVAQHEGLPRFVHGDGRRVRQALSNVTANAVSHTDSGSVMIEVYVKEIREHHAIVEFAVADSGSGMSSQKLDNLFRDLEQVSTEEPDEQAQDPSDTRTLGLGLAVVARIVRNMDGQLRLKSEENHGSRFVMQLPFQLPDETPKTGEEGGGKTRQSVPESPPIATPNALAASSAGEITLVERASQVNLRQSDHSLPDDLSGGSRRSIHSHHSQDSHGSDAERLIHAIQTPLSLHENETEFPLSRHSSRGSSTKAQSTGGFSAGSRSLSPQSRKMQRRSQPSSPTRSRGSGSVEVRDTKTALRAVKIPDDYQDLPNRPQVSDSSRVLFEVASDKSQKTRSESVTSGGTGDGLSLQVLIAEDDPINLRILKKRLERAGHEVYHAVNGEDCATVYKEKPQAFDVVLMDMQMPIVDGLTSTKMIRAYEKSPDNKGHSKLAAGNGRIPIFAVSASLVESSRQTYIDAGFDGWILKPVDFKRLNTLLMGICDDDTRNACMYVSGEWERGGWLCPRDQEHGSQDSTPRATEDEKEEMVTDAEATAQEAANDLSIKGVADTEEAS
ncbi:hypothetical protein NLU13_9917 [Sarocladium strictum]|uniref:Phytochrome n=1 Tax=Sarocladium strictum TaxID=5046 RepID=A0AA39G8V5_SARSR|nr:hypothetical protein NLU13_9917 [Sarocladium strictum]